jgi:hypothetical protein
MLQQPGLCSHFAEDDTDQIRAAVLAVGHLEGYPSTTTLVDAVTFRVLRRLQGTTTGERSG